MGEQPDWVEPLGRKIGELTEQRMWTLTTLASKAGVAYKTVFRIVENDYERGPDLGTLRKVLGVFGSDGVQALRDVGKDGWADTLQSEITATGLDDTLKTQIEALVRELWQEMRHNDNN